MEKHKRDRKLQHKLKSLNNKIQTNFPKICDEDYENDKNNDIKLYTLKD